MNRKQDFVIKNGVLIKYKGTGRDVIIPAGVKKIADYTFYGRTGLTSVVIPEGVTAIGWCAFSGCMGLQSVVVAEGVTTNISKYDFRDTPWLKNLGEFAVVNHILLAYQGNGGDVVIPEDVTVIGNSAFEGCKGLKSVVIPEGVTVIGNSAFEGCMGLQSVVIPEGVKRMGNSAFDGCKDLTSVVIPESVTEIGWCAFDGCKELQSVVIPEGITEIGYGAFRGCKGLQSVVIPEGVTSMGSSAFEGCTSLTSVVIPEGVTEIGWCAFDGCTGLQSVVIPEGVKNIGECAFSGCTGLTSVTIPEGVTVIGYGVFYGCTGLQQIDLPHSIRKIEVDKDGEKLYPTMPEGLPLTTDRLNQGIAVQIDHVWHEQMTVKDWAGLYLFQRTKAFQALYGKYMKAPAEEYLSVMLELLEGCKRASAYVRAANYAVDHVRELSPESIQALYDLAAAKKNKKALELLELLVKDTKTQGGT